MSDPRITGRVAARSGGFSAFVRLGLADASARLARLTGHEPPDDGELADVCERSAVARGIGRAAETFRRASRGSIVVARAAAVREAWLAQPVVDRTRRAGIALVIAAVVHLLLEFSRGPMAGWLWLVIPLLALAFGGLMAIAPARGVSPESRR